MVLVPRWLAPLLRAAPKARPPHARAILDAERPWDELRKGLASAVLVDPAAARPALAALRAAARQRRDPSTGARLHMLEGHAIHRAGRVDEALSAYVEAERALRAAGLIEEALSVGVSRVDALATAGHVAEALSLAKRLARGFAGRPPSNLSASLEINRGNALRLLGDYEEAFAAYEAAAKALDKLGSPYLAGVARLNGGVALLESGETEAATARFTTGVDDFRAQGLTDLEREARYNLAWSHVHAGRLGEGIRGLQLLADEHKAGGLLRREALCRMDLADALLRAGDLAGGEREALRAALSFDSSGALAERAEALWFAAASAAPTAVSRAVEHLAAAKAAARKAGRPAVTLRCDVLRADLASRARGASRAKGTTKSGASELARLEKRARALDQRAILSDVLLLRAAQALDAGRVAEARRRFEIVLASSGGRPWVRSAAETGIARADARDPRRVGEALARLRKVARFLDGVRAGLPGSWLRAQFVAERLDPYLARVDLLLARDRPADRREAESLLDALAARRFLAARPPSVEPDRLARIRARLESIYDRLARGEGPTRGADGGFAEEAFLERRARAWERSIAETWRRTERRGSTTDADADAPGGVAPARQELSRDTVLVHLWRHGDRVRGLVRTGAQVGPGIDLGSFEDVEGFCLSLRIRAHRWAFLREHDAAATDPAAVERVLEQLAELVLGPLGADRWPSDVRIVADPSLPDLPWEMLPLCGGRLGESCRILRMPAGQADPVAARRARPAGEGTVVIGVGEPDLPGVEAEIEAIANAARAVQVVSGASATRAAVAHALSTANVVHLAGHGWEVGEVPPLGGVRVADGWFTAADLPPGGVAADLVVLAACRTGGGYGRSAVAWGGLVPALLATGVRRVLWTLDDVDDAATAHLMTLFHSTRAASDDLAAFGAALSRGAADAGHAGAVLAFRLSGVSS